MPMSIVLARHQIEPPVLTGHFVKSKGARTMLKRTVSLLAVVVLSACVGLAQAQTKTYVIMAKGQGAGSTSFASALGSSVIAQYDGIGIVIAQSSDPNFAAQAAALSGVQSVTP